MPHAVTLRPITVEDADAMADVLSGPRLYSFIGGEPPTVAELEERYEFQSRGQSPDGSERWLNLAVILASTQQPIGYVQATVCKESQQAEIAWVIGQPWQGQGHASRAAQLLVESLREDGVTDLIAHIHPEHVASEAIARRLGMTPTAIVVDGETRWTT